MGESLVTATGEGVAVVMTASRGGAIDVTSYSNTQNLLPYTFLNSNISNTSIINDQNIINNYNNQSTQFNINSINTSFSISTERAHIQIETDKSSESTLLNDNFDDPIVGESLVTATGEGVAVVMTASRGGAIDVISYSDTNLNSSVRAQNTDNVRFKCSFCCYSFKSAIGKPYLNHLDLDFRFYNCLFKIDSCRLGKLHNFFL